MSDDHRPRPGFRPLKGRGATISPPARFEPTHTVAVDDGWTTRQSERDDGVKTLVKAERTRSIIAENDSPDIPFERSINPYKGCEHGCIYCFARPSHAYLGLSPGLDFETRIIQKPEGPQRLEELFSSPRYRPKVIALGANTDPYQPIERELGLTRQLLEVLHRYRHPVSIVTKSNLVLRDLELLAEMAAMRLASVCVSLTTLDPRLARKMEPRATTPARRVEAIARLSRAGVPVRVLASPMIPAINDHELEAVLQAAADAGATAASYILVRLPGEVKELFIAWLEQHFADRAARVLELIRQTRGGELYRSGFGQRMRGEGPYAELLAQRFARACRQLGLDRPQPELDTTQFCRPEPHGQLSLFAR